MTFFKKKQHNQTGLIVAIAIVVGLVSFGMSYALTNKKAESRKDCNGTCVGLYKNKAIPDTIAVVRGTFVQFNSKDGKTHDLSLGKGGEHHEHTGTFQSGDFNANEAWRVQFKDDGSYYFHDHLNPAINILVVVYTPGKDYTIH